VGDVEWEVRVAEELAGHDDYVGLVAGEDGAGFGGGIDHADRAGHHAGFAADAFGEADLVSGAYGNFGVGHVATGGAVDEIDAERAELIGQGDGLVDIPAARGPVGGRDADEERIVFGPDFADGDSDFADQARAIVERNSWSK
jgi:hypothetical protein